MARFENDTPAVSQEFRETTMACLQNNIKGEDHTSRYATSDDFRRVFVRELECLYQLSFLVTRDHEKAEACLLASLEDCYRAKHVFKNWVLCWAKRRIIQNAIRELRPGRHSCSPSSAEPRFGYGCKLHDGLGGHFEAEALLALEDLERFVFVISVLERYSDSDCAVLLGCSPREVRRARTQASLHIANSGHTDSLRSGEEVATVMYWLVPGTLRSIHIDAMSAGSSPRSSPEPR